VLAILLVVVGLSVVRRAISIPWLSPAPRITHELVVDQLRDVAKLVSTEMTMRDVVIYEQTRFGFSKRALLVVTGKVLAGSVNVLRCLRPGSLTHRARDLSARRARACVSCSQEQACPKRKGGAFKQPTVSFGDALTDSPPSLASSPYRFAPGAPYYA